LSRAFFDFFAPLFKIVRIDKVFVVFSSLLRLYFSVRRWYNIFTLAARVAVRIKRKPYPQDQAYDSLGNGACAFFFCLNPYF